MADNFIYQDEVIEFVADAAVTSGDFLLIGSTRVVAMTSAAIGETFTARPRGVFRAPKATGVAVGQGNLAYWDASNKNFTSSASGNTQFGRFERAQVSADTECRVMIVN